MGRNKVCVDDAEMLTQGSTIKIQMDDEEAICCEWSIIRGPRVFLGRLVWFLDPRLGTALHYGILLI